MRIPFINKIEYNYKTMLLNIIKEIRGKVLSD